VPAGFERHQRDFPVPSDCTTAPFSSRAKAIAETPLKHPVFKEMGWRAGQAQDEGSLVVVVRARGHHAAAQAGGSALESLTLFVIIFTFVSGVIVTLFCVPLVWTAEWSAKERWFVLLNRVHLRNGLKTAEDLRDNYVYEVQKVGDIRLQILAAERHLTLIVILSCGAVVLTFLLFEIIKAGQAHFSDYVLLVCLLPGFFIVAGVYTTWMQRRTYQAITDPDLFRIRTYRQIRKVLKRAGAADDEIEEWVLKTPEFRPPADYNKLAPPWLPRF
jgi:hypothetical protein